ncbi:MAG: hypothetical protein ATN35_08565 [Epulopiscium sp. Nele67-Bin004]|nr:MAG: hypothetical protein ATN35_08565 [Epulopiscium sp. Nele67-Bin004]
MENVYFKPFVGKNYENTNPKIMMLGESHYLREENQTPESTDNWARGMTISLMNDTINGEQNLKTFNNAKAVVTGDYHSNNAEFWNNVIFTIICKVLSAIQL